MTTFHDAVTELCRRSHAISDIHAHEGAALEYRDELGEMQQFPACRVSPEELARVLGGERGVPELRALVEERGGDVDLTAFVGDCRFRANLYFHGGARALGISLRRLHESVPSFRSLRLPDTLVEWCDRRTGLLLVTGPSGSGKTSTLAAIVNHINETRRGHVVLIEDPIEYLHRRKQSLITQREVGGDARSFASSLHAAVRQNPDVIVVGEIRDRETMETALFASETGHLVLATLHSTSASRAPERVIDFFAEDLRSLARAQLGATLIGVIAQVLVPRADRKGKILACECLSNTKEASAHIRDGRFQALDNVMSQSGSATNMWALNTYLSTLVYAGEIHAEAAVAAAYNRLDMQERLGAADGTGTVIALGR
jgi:twitching motility protein PilT